MGTPRIGGAVQERISSSDWTGPVGEGQRRGVFTHHVGDHAITSDFQRILEAQHAATAIPPELRSIKRRAALLLVAPALLWLAWHLVAWATRDQLVHDNSQVLVTGGLAVMALAAWQLQSRSTVLIALRRLFVSILTIATVTLAIAYTYFGIDAHAQAISSTPERTFERYEVLGRKAPFRKVIVWHPREDGSTIQGIRMHAPLAYSNVCALVQRLDGPHGFSWVRVLDRSRPPGRGQLSWPIRREECFSDIPLSSLPR
jgi:hypothetical protein